MTVVFVTAAPALVASTFSPNAVTFAATQTIIAIATNLVQYGAAFALLVQLAPNVAQCSITYLTLIAGFASTIFFWPSPQPFSIGSPGNKPICCSLTFICFSACRYTFCSRV